MGQQDILIFLKRNANKWFLASEINAALGTAISCTTMSLKRLREANLIAFKTIGKRSIFQYKYVK